MADAPETPEDLAAGLLSGAMVCLLSAAFPGFLIWEAVAKWETWTADLRSVLVWDSLIGVALLAISIQLMRVGARHLWRNLRALRRLRQSPPTL